MREELSRSEVKLPDPQEIAPGVPVAAEASPTLAQKVDHAARQARAMGANHQVKRTGPSTVHIANGMVTGGRNA